MFRRYASRRYAGGLVPQHHTAEGVISLEHKKCYDIMTDEWYIIRTPSGSVKYIGFVVITRTQALNAGGLSSVVNVIGTQMRGPINTGLTRWRLTVSVRTCMTR